MQAAASAPLPPYERNLLKVWPKTTPPSDPFDIDGDVCWEVFEHLLRLYFDLRPNTVLQYRPVMIKEKKDRQWKAFFGEDDLKKLLDHYKGTAVYVRVAPEVSYMFSKSYLICFRRIL